MRILLADNQPKVRFALRVLLERQAGYEIVGEIDTAEELVPQVESSCPDLVLLGWELPGLAPDDAISVLHEIRPKLHVIALSGRLEARHAALAAGADDFVSKADPPERLLMAIGCCRQGGYDVGSSNVANQQRPPRRAAKDLRDRPASQND